MKLNIFFLCLLFLYCEFARGQNDFEEWNIVSESRDTLVKSYSAEFYFDYFTQRNFSIIVDFSEEEYYQELRISKYSKCGYLKVYFKDKILFKYPVINYEVSGLGFFYKYQTGNPTCLAIFKNSKLNGTLIFFDNSSEIKFVAQYRRGKFKKFEYHREAQNQLELARFNDYIRFDPLLVRFSPELIK